MHTARGTRGHPLPALCDKPFGGAGQFVRPHDYVVSQYRAFCFEKKTLPGVFRRWSVFQLDADEFRSVSDAVVERMNRLVLDYRNIAPIDRPVPPKDQLPRVHSRDDMKMFSPIISSDYRGDGCQAQD